ncbi:hypothetical protein NLG97_g6521 [Lecanicillium saksenae]|uniref:Uncharacterized protein n=1 Tax=Lecanicillium saksenae TaxID=468837 RepID=A0ACC1QPF3_9HYPO|nr:hypothetical protein NLG97_g6521 [Lecanicillium saksenae]
MDKGSSTDFATSRPDILLENSSTPIATLFRAKSPFEPRKRTIARGPPLRFQPSTQRRKTGPPAAGPQFLQSSHALLAALVPVFLNGGAPSLITHLPPPTSPPLPSLGQIQVASRPATQAGNVSLMNRQTAPLGPCQALARTLGWITSIATMVIMGFIANRWPEKIGSIAAAMAGVSPILVFSRALVFYSVAFSDRKTRVFRRNSISARSGRWLMRMRGVGIPNPQLMMRNNGDQESLHGAEVNSKLTLEQVAIALLNDSWQMMSVTNRSMGFEPLPAARAMLHDMVSMAICLGGIVLVIFTGTSVPKSDDYDLQHSLDYSQYGEAFTLRKLMDAAHWFLMAVIFRNQSSSGCDIDGRWRKLKLLTHNDMFILFSITNYVYTATACGMPRPFPPPGDDSQTDKLSIAHMSGNFSTQPISNLPWTNEQIFCYHWGGCHPISLGDVLKDGRYKIANKLGWGNSSVVWLAKDTLYDLISLTPIYALRISLPYSSLVANIPSIDRWVAVKILTSKASTSRRPVAALTALLGDPSTSGLVPELYNSFFHHGPIGAHVCLVLELLGPSLYVVIERL